MIRTLLPLLAAGTLGACAAGNCDPARAGFLDGIGCQTSGAYDVRQTQIQSNLAAARSNLRAEQGRTNAAYSQAGQAQADQARAARSLAGMQAQNAVLRRRLDTAARQDGANRAVVQQRQAELSALERDQQETARNGVDPAQVQDLERRRKALLDAASGL